MRASDTRFTLACLHLLLGLIVIMGLAVQRSEEDHIHALFPPIEPVNKQPMGYIVNRIVLFERFRYFLPSSHPHAPPHTHTQSLIPPRPSHTELIRENKRVELISTGFPGEREAKSAINSIFTQLPRFCY